MDEDKKLNGTVEATILRLDGKIATFSTADMRMTEVYSGEVVGASLARADITLAKKDFDVILNRLNTLEDFAASIENQPTVEDTYSVSIKGGIPGLAKGELGFTRKITKKK